MNDAELKSGKVIEFTCNGRGRGGHYHVTATITKVNPKTVSAIEANRSYRPGTRWTVAKTEIKKVREPVGEHECTFCKGTGKWHGHKCDMCVNGKVPHETHASVKESLAAQEGFKRFIDEGE